jgi:hypothetical protein
MEFDCVMTFISHPRNHVEFHTSMHGALLAMGKNNVSTAALLEQDVFFRHTPYTEVSDT